MVYHQCQSKDLMTQRGAVVSANYKVFYLLCVGAFTSGELWGRCHQMYFKGRQLPGCLERPALPLCFLFFLCFPLWTPPVSVPAERKERRREGRGKRRAEEEDERDGVGGGWGDTSCETSSSSGSERRWAPSPSRHTAAKSHYAEGHSATRVLKLEIQHVWDRSVREEKMIHVVKVKCLMLTLILHIIFSDHHL